MDRVALPFAVLVALVGCAQDENLAPDAGLPAISVSCPRCELYGAAAPEAPLHYELRWHDECENEVDWADEPLVLPCNHQAFQLAVDCGELACEVGDPSSQPMDVPRPGIARVAISALETGTLAVGFSLSPLDGSAVRVVEAAPVDVVEPDRLRITCFDQDAPTEGIDCGEPQGNIVRWISVQAFRGNVQVHVAPDVRAYFQPSTGPEEPLRLRRARPIEDAALRDRSGPTYYVHTRSTGSFVEATWGAIRTEVAF